jgi:uncharacterized repeat protein (TIGR03803 family)
MLNLSLSLTVLHTFTCGRDGGFPLSNLILSKGKLYGTTSVVGRYGYGNLFAVTKLGKFEVVHGFSSDPDGAYPYAGLTRDSKGNLFGTTEQGGLGAGTIYEVTP